MNSYEYHVKTSLSLTHKYFKNSNNDKTRTTLTFFRKWKTPTPSPSRLHRPWPPPADFLSPLIFRKLGSLKQGPHNYPLKHWAVLTSWNLESCWQPQGWGTSTDSTGLACPGDVKDWDHGWPPLHVDAWMSVPPAAAFDQLTSRLHLSLALPGLMEIKRTSICFVFIFSKSSHFFCLFWALFWYN